jgi:hypothetical protein
MKKLKLKREAAKYYENGTKQEKKRKFLSEKDMKSLVGGASQPTNPDDIRLLAVKRG